MKKITAIAILLITAIITTAAVAMHPITPDTHKHICCKHTGDLQFVCESIPWGSECGSSLDFACEYL